VQVQFIIIIIIIIMTNTWLKWTPFSVAMPLHVPHVLRYIIREFQIESKWAM